MVCYLDRRILPEVGMRGRYVWPRYRALKTARAQCVVVRRLQRRVHARESPLLLSTHCHRLPFASARALYGLSKLSVWWLRLGMQIERIKGHPQQNGRHERMHLTLKKEATKPAASNVLSQQARFDAFVTRRAGWNRSKIPSVRKCYPCLRNELLPMIR